MSSMTAISVDKLARLIGTSKCPVVVDVRTDVDFALAPRLSFMRFWANGNAQTLAEGLRAALERAKIEKPGER